MWEKIRKSIGRPPKEPELLTPEEVNKKIAEALRSQEQAMYQQLNVSELFIDAEETGALAKLMPYVSGIISLIVLIVLVMK